MVSLVQYKGGYETEYTGQAAGDIDVATANFSAVGAAFNNGSNKYIRATAVFDPVDAWSPTGGAFNCWLLESVDGGTTYEVTPTSAGLATSRLPDFSIPVMAGTSVTVKNFAFSVILKPGYQKLVVYNSTGATPSANATLKLYPWSVQQS